MSRKVIALHKMFDSMIALCDDGTIHQYVIKGESHSWNRIKLPDGCEVRSQYPHGVGTGTAFAPDRSWPQGASGCFAPHPYMGPTGAAVPVSAQPPPSVSNKTEPEPDNDEPFAEWIR